MAVWAKSIMEYNTDEGLETCPCEVKIDNGVIAVSYFDEGHRTYEGREVEPGHFTLTCPALKGSANLHRFKDDGMLVGSWAEDGLLGLWRIDLDDGGVD